MVLDEIFENSSLCRLLHRPLQMLNRFLKTKILSSRIIISKNQKKPKAKKKRQNQRLSISPKNEEPIILASKKI